MPKEEKDIRVIAWTTSKLLETAFPVLWTGFPENQLEQVDVFLC